MQVSVIGLGYVGSVAAAALAWAGHEVKGIDVDREKVDAYRSGALPIYEPGLGEMMRAVLDQGSLRIFHTSEVAEPLGEAVVIAAGTPADETGNADLSQVRSAVSWVKERDRGGSVILMKSTVPPGTGKRLMQTLLKDAPYQYISNPEFLREGQAVSDWFHPDRIVIGGGCDEAIKIARALYRPIEAPFVATDITSAEMIKYAANAFLATKISFINEIALLCDSVGATIDNVVEGIALDPRIGPSFLRAGVGYGGSCFPKDVRALDQLALTNGHSFELLRSVIAVNNRQGLLPLYALRRRFGKLSGVTIGVLGLSFKPYTDDIREAPSINLLRHLLDEGAVVKAFDPMALSAARGIVDKSVKLVQSVLCCAEGAEALVLMTEWPEIVEAPWEEIVRCTRQPRFIFDGRNALDGAKMQELGFDYVGVGRGSVTSAPNGHAAPGSFPVGMRPVVPITIADASP